jgi:RHS repeat-associated protein
MALITGSAFAAIPKVLPEFKNEKQLAEWREEMAAKHAASTTPTEDHAFYTGKPYIESSGNYAFKYRSYNPELARWTSEDPSGFPDGANINIYAPNPNSEFDPDGLATQTFNAKYDSIWTAVNVNSNATITFELSKDKKSIESKSVGWGDLLGIPSDNGTGNSNGWIESASTSAETTVRYDTDPEGRFAIITVHFLSVFKRSEEANPTNTQVGLTDSEKIRLEYPTE